MVRKGKRDTVGPKYAFINWTTDPSQKQQETSTLVKRHVMRPIAVARRRTGVYGQHNLGQIPRFTGALSDYPYSCALVDPPDMQSEADDGSREEVALSRKSDNRSALNDQETSIQPDGMPRLSMSIPPEIAPHPLECLQVTDGFSLLNLSFLTTLILGYANRSAFVYPGSSLPQVFQRTTPSYLSYLPARYGQVMWLTDAVECLIARVKCIIRGSTTKDENVAIRLYVKALHSLQEALNDVQASKSAETLCSAMILQLAEVMGGYKTNNVPEHCMGASQLILHRGPNAFGSAFERELLSACAGPIVTSCLMNNQTCFLAEPRWTGALKASIQSDPSFCTQSRLAVDLWETLVVCPNLFRAVTIHICSGQPSTEEQTMDLVQRVLLDKKKVIEWHASYKQKTTYIARPSSLISFSMNDSVRLCSGTKRKHEVYATYLSCLILMDRLLSSLAPRRFAPVEDEAQALAQEILELQRKGQIGNDDLQKAIFKVQTSWNAKATLATKEIWQASATISNGGTIGKDAFEEWCRQLGRSVTLQMPLNTIAHSSNHE